MHRQHYRPRTPLFLHIPRTGRGAYLFLNTGAADHIRNLRMPANAAEYGARFYGTLHELDAEALDWIAVEMPPDTPEWAAIRDRLRRAASDS
jgi:L-threonylcarbamoyladenylate synthase